MTKSNVVTGFNVGDCQIYRRASAVFVLTAFLLGFGAVSLAQAVTPMAEAVGQSPAQTPAQAPTQTWSDQLKFLEVNPQAVLELEKSEAKLSHERLKKRPQSAKIESILRARMAPQRILQSSALTSGSRLELVDLGLGKSIDLVERPTQNSVGGAVASSIRLASNFDISRKNTVRFSSFSLSPDERYVIISSERNGSIDEVPLVIVDRKTKTTLENDLISTGEGRAEIKWLSSAIFWFTDKSGQNLTVDLSQGTRAEKSVQSVDGTFPFYVVCEANQVFYVDSIPTEAAKTLIPKLNCSSWVEILSSDRHGFEILRRLRPHRDQLAIDRYQIVSLADGRPQVQLTSFTRSDQQVFGHFYRFGTTDFITTSWGADQFIWIVNSADQTNALQKLPSYASVATINEAVPGKTVKINLESMVTSDREYEYDWTTRSWVGRAPDERIDLSSKAGLKYKDQIMMVQSRDGIALPVRLTYLASTVVNESTPVFMKYYGGYDSPGSFYPHFNFNTRELFINHGGVFVTPIIRGGNEYGDNWHLQAVKQNRAVSAFDIIDIARALSLQKIGSNKTLVTTGTSAGGFLTLASGLLSPKDFGLLIAISPPTDILAKVRLDTRFFGQPKEYGSPFVEAERAAMLTYSPLELPVDVQTMPQIFLLAGADDSRVNPLHSVKFASKMRSLGIPTEKFNAKFVKNAGHWLADYRYQDLVGWRTTSDFWIRIYDFFGWSS